LARKILLADDSVTAQNMGRKILADAGYDVVTVNNGSAALKRITEIKPDLIVLDVYMPGYSGLEVCQRLKESGETAHIPVLLTVGKLEPFKPEEARRVRADAHIVKPFEASELLTAIMRLEDRMVPQQADGSRFSTSVSGVERFSGEPGGRKTEGTDDSDTGWKSRLRFPSKKKKEEPEPEPEEIATETTFRDYRKGKSKAGASGTFAVKPAAPAGQESGLVPDIPRDITPEELDALSALAAKLDGPTPAENIAPAERLEAAAIEPALANPEFEAPASMAGVVEAQKEIEIPAPVVETVRATVEAPAIATEEKFEGKVEAKNEVGVPVEPVSAPTEAAAVFADSLAAESRQPASESSQVSPVVATVAVNPAVPLVPSQEGAPADTAAALAFFATSGTAEHAVGEKIEAATIKEKTAEAVVVAKAEAPELGVSTESADTKNTDKKNTDTKNLTLPPEEESKMDGFSTDEAKIEESKFTSEESQPSKIEQAVTAADGVPEPEEAAPSDEELAEALRLLTPATVHPGVSTTPSHGTLVAAGQLLAEEAARNAAAAPRWMAESVALSPEEAALSLEAEMFRTFATTSATTPAAVQVASPTPAYDSGFEPTPITGLSAITAAVENRLAEAEILASAKVTSVQAADGSPETPAAEKSAVTISEEPPVNEIAPQRLVGEQISQEQIDVEKLEAERKDSRPQVVKEPESVAEELAAATLADAVGKNQVEAATVEAATMHDEQPVNEPSVSEPAVAVGTAEDQNSNSDSGGEESMGKSGKSNWHQIRTTPAGSAASSNPVEAAKQDVEAPKAMAAAASAEGSASASTTDASTIASIVDSVMADLRPRIVEEIAKKLAGK
jgi:CheY-like chemotaxis protein